MNGLSTKYKGQVDFFHFDVDQSATAEALRELNVRRRSTYILIAPDGTEITRWIGPIGPELIIPEIDAQLAANS